MNESESRILINKLLEKSGWDFGVNIKTEQPVKHSEGEKGFADYLLFDSLGHPLCVVEAKKSDKSPLDGKEQARKYAKELKARFIILSNGEVHYFWDMENGNPKPILEYPSQVSLEEAKKIDLKPERLANVLVDENYLALTQYPDFTNTPEYKQGGEERDKFIKKNDLIILRPYQLGAIHAVQNAAKEGKERFLLEMATGTGKTKTCIALSKLFLTTKNAHRILFLVDRIELEEQAYKDYKTVLKDWTSVIYKQNKSDWKKADVVITTVQSLLHNDRYKKDFLPTDFDLVVSDEAHRSISGNARAVFEYFVGYKLGLTATPKDYLKNINREETHFKELERRELLNTYSIFGCDSGEPTYIYDLGMGAQDGYLIQPYVLDARTKITTELLSKEGFEVEKTREDGATEKQVYFGTHFERKFFNEETNWEFCKKIIEKGLADPITGEFGKTLIFCRTQRHAAKITNILNELAMKRWQGVYESDFAVQITSNVDEAQQMTTNFTNNKLGGVSTFAEDAFPEYKTSKTRVCVTVSMMTTGYDCPDLLNVAFLRPVFSPADFIQMKGRGTRPHTFVYKPDDIHTPKESFRLFDFFAVCEYFEREFKYDEALKLPPSVERLNTEEILSEENNPENYTEEELRVLKGEHHHKEWDTFVSEKEEQVGATGMRVDREAFGARMREELSKDEELKSYYQSGDVVSAVEYFKREIYDKPNLYLTRERVMKGFKLDRLPSFSEILEYVFGDREKFDMSSDVLHRTWDDYIALYGDSIPDELYSASFQTFSAYVEDAKVREIIDHTKTYGELFQYGIGEDWSKLTESLRQKIPQYARDFVVER